MYYCYLCNDSIPTVNGPQTAIRVPMDGQKRLVHQDCYEQAQDAWRDAPQDEDYDSFSFA
jgi:hypothetical protein